MFTEHLNQVFFEGTRLELHFAKKTPAREMQTWAPWRVYLETKAKRKTPKQWVTQANRVFAGAAFEVLGDFLYINTGTGKFSMRIASY